MKESMFLLFILVAPVLCEDVIPLVATKESQNLTSPSLEGISRPHDFKWRVRLNTTGIYSNLVVILHYLDVPERNNCSGSYIELLDEHNSLGQRSAELREETFDVFGSYLDIVFHIGTEDGTHEFKMSYFLNTPEIVTCYGLSIPPFWAFILLMVVVLCSVIIVCCCVYRRCRKGKQNVATNASNSSHFEKSPDSVITGPPSYDDVIKGDCKPPPYSSVVDA